MTKGGQALVRNRNAELLASGPRWLSVELRPHAGRIAAAIMHEVQRSVPAYSRPLTGTFGKVFSEGFEEAVRHVIDSIGNPGIVHNEWVEMFRTRGRLEYLEGRSLDSLQAAARIGARVAWQYVAPVLRRAGASPQVLAHSAEIIFAYVEELSATALEGYSETQALAGGTIERRRKQLLELLLSDAPTAPGALDGMSRGAGWPLPEQAAVVALEGSCGTADFPVELLDDDVLVDLESSTPCLLTTRPRGQLLPLSGRWNGWRAAVSPTVPLADIPAAHRLARRALCLLPPPESDAPILWCADHLAEVWLLGEEFLATELRRRALHPLDSLGDRQRERLGQTLLAWLETRGGAPEIARRLRVHPQTVRARLHQLRELLGGRLDDPDERFGMLLALRAELLAAAGGT
ncbi:helix-turn-helix domain-containing protein [Amycolatopsis cynarae]|uniref:Helix-turn-helix domain-containing protein n=1 Tax=Amycolatopsis cynarae TaxID=2995223 RepID=A0ABY7BDU5_9PSEU|nr:PucR family transcriptional regulator [Amycolatopsis sp. HUAS 11-8]WAL69427.1 helix-turn-helix domain-containing protein [Amycolatopsis sp. HUAS 11-8]